MSVGPLLFHFPVSEWEPGNTFFAAFHHAIVGENPLPSSPSRRRVVVGNGGGAGRSRVAKTTTSDTPVVAGVPVVKMTGWAEDWYVNMEYRGLSQTTLANRKLLISKFLWFCAEYNIARIERAQIERFIAYVRNGGTFPEGRWNNGQQKRSVRPLTVLSYFAILRAFFGFCLKEQYITVSPLQGLDAPKAAQDQIQPFTDDEAAALLRAAGQTINRRRDTAILSVLLETAMRVSEMAALKRSDLNLGQHQIRVYGKGGKYRTVCFGLETKQALVRYLSATEVADDGPLFAGTKGENAGKALTRSGILQLLERLGKAAGVEGKRCSPHTCRHFAAVTYIRNDADAFTVKSLLGHTSIKQTERYVELGQADMSVKVRKHSPLDNLRKQKKTETGKRP